MSCWWLSPSIFFCGFFVLVVMLVVIHTVPSIVCCMCGFLYIFHYGIICIALCSLTFYMSYLSLITCVVSVIGDCACV